jgi:adenylyl- and sulfurtransferase ThiI
MNSKCIKELNVRSEMVKLLQQKIRDTLDHIGIGNNFINRTQLGQQLRKCIDKQDCMKLK